MNALEYEARRLAHRPTDAAGIAREVKRLSASGYSSRDIAGCLGLDRIAVERMLQADFHRAIETTTTLKKSQ